MVSLLLTTKEFIWTDLYILIMLNVILKGQILSLHYVKQKILLVILHGKLMGKKHKGVHSIEELASLSGYKNNK
ncbi:MAG: hypothetical protein CM1200mP7_3840 [Chloroflexota bacterium]|nr:MAG: hypothetical protein CM1200mP7_3840 [Chloroflexota bacterium]